MVMRVVSYTCFLHFAQLVTEALDIVLIKIGMNILQLWGHRTFYLLLSYHR